MVPSASGDSGAASRRGRASERQAQDRGEQGDDGGHQHRGMWRPVSEAVLPHRLDDQVDRAGHGAVVGDATLVETRRWVMVRPADAKTMLGSVDRIAMPRSPEAAGL